MFCGEPISLLDVVSPFLLRAAESDATCFGGEPPLPPLPATRRPVAAPRRSAAVLWAVGAGGWNPTKKGRLGDEGKKRGGVPPCTSHTPIFISPELLGVKCGDSDIFRPLLEGHSPCQEIFRPLLEGHSPCQELRISAFLILYKVLGRPCEYRVLSTRLSQLESGRSLASSAPRARLRAAASDSSKMSIRGSVEHDAAVGQKSGLFKGNPHLALRKGSPL